MSNLLFVFAIMASVTTQAADSGVGCDSLEITFRGAPKKFNTELSEVEKRIDSICNKQQPANDKQIREMATSCSSGTASKGEFSVYQFINPFIVRADDLCKIAKEAKTKVRSQDTNKESFCGNFSVTDQKTKDLFQASNEQKLIGKKSEILERLKKLKEDHKEAAANYASVNKDAIDFKKQIDQKLPGQITNDARTVDPSLEALAKNVERARARRVNELTKSAAQNQDALNACKRLEYALIRYVDLMEDNLLPNARRLSKLLGAAAISANEKSAKHAVAANEVSANIARLDSGVDRVSSAAAGNNDRNNCAQNGCSAGVAAVAPEGGAISGGGTTAAISNPDTSSAVAPAQQAPKKGQVSAAVSTLSSLFSSFGQKK